MDREVVTIWDEDDDHMLMPSNDDDDTQSVPAAATPKDPMVPVTAVETKPWGMDGPPSNVPWCTEEEEAAMPMMNYRPVTPPAHTLPDDNATDLWQTDGGHDETGRFLQPQRSGNGRRMGGGRGRDHRSRRRPMHRRLSPADPILYVVLPNTFIPYTSQTDEAVFRRIHGSLGRTVASAMSVAVGVLTRMLAPDLPDIKTHVLTFAAGDTPEQMQSRMLRYVPNVVHKCTDRMFVMVCAPDMPKLSSVLGTTSWWGTFPPQAYYRR